MSLKRIVTRYGLALLLFGILLLVVLSLVDIKLPGNVLDKLAHFLTYFILASLAFHRWPGRKKTRLAAGLLFMLGVGIELAQIFVDARFVSFRDLASNAAGIFAAYVVQTWMRRPVQTPQSDQDVSGRDMAGRCASRG